MLGSVLAYVLNPDTTYPLGLNPDPCVTGQPEPSNRNRTERQTWRTAADGVKDRGTEEGEGEKQEIARGGGFVSGFSSSSVSSASSSVSRGSSACNYWKKERGGRKNMGMDWESLTEATSGAVGALVSTTVLYPLDTCKTKYQAEVRDLDADGHGRPPKYRNLTDVLWEAISTRNVLSLYQGLGTKNLQSFISQFVYFYGYSYFKRLYLENCGAKSIGTKANLVIAAAAGACTAIVTQPLDTASSRMQTSEFGKSKGLWETLTEKSWNEAFNGLGISLLLTSNPAIQYTVFDQLKQRLLKSRENGKVGSNVEVSPATLSAFSAFVLGAVSKSIATVLTYPAIRCKVMIQSSTSSDETKEDQSKSPKTFIEALSSIWKREGALGFFKGLEAQILKTVLSSALLLMIKEKVSKSTWVLMLAIRSN
ncbi:hypothetical protein Taro_016820 [Colocasia esculenta]|uniref:Peroxisomal adenine nucleotide carrier 1 n=1 Tax=Colocasia esculenta TaxID=4460 RepID=A0A843ULF0_COLES|nr:hypothetical protein [Colocasia esculenta]